MLPVRNVDFVRQLGRPGGHRWLLADRQIEPPAAARARAREPRLATTAGHCAAQDQTPQADPSGPRILGRTLPSVARLAERPDHREAPDRDRLASQGLQALLDLEEPKQRRTPTDRCGDPDAHTAHPAEVPRVLSRIPLLSWKALSFPQPNTSLSTTPSSIGELERSGNTCAPAPASTQLQASANTCSIAVSPVISLLASS